MSLRQSTNANPIRKLLLLNCAYWILFWSVFAFSKPTVFGADIDEGAIFGRTLSGTAETVRDSSEIAMLPQFPSIIATDITLGTVLRSRIASPTRLWRTSVTGFLLLASMLVSFLQWWAIGWLVVFFRRKRPKAIEKAA